MTRRSSRRSPDLPQRPPQETKAVDTHSRRKPPRTQQTVNSLLTDLKPSIAANWHLPSNNINTCVKPGIWPLNERDPGKWPAEVVHLLHEASQLSRGNNKIFQSELGAEIQSRQLKSRSAKSKIDHMTVTDLKKVCKRLEALQEGEAAVQEGEKQTDADARPARRTRASAKPDSNTDVENTQTREETENPEDKKTTAPRVRGRPKRKDPKEQNPIKPGTKRQASDLPLRPARKVRGGKSPKPEPTAPPPITPANPPENSDDEEEDQENEPPEPVSGRHIYGAIIKPTTLTFNPGDEPTARALPRQTRKRGRADNDAPPTQVQIDSDPRDIDATGFLSELDPKEMRRRRKPRLSRLQQERVEEPPWSQEFPAPPETPMLTPAVGEMGVGMAAVSSPARPVLDVGEGDESAAIEMLLLDLLPSIPDTATPDERRMLETRMSLIQRDIVAYRTAVSDIETRVNV